MGACSILLAFLAQNVFENICICKNFKWFYSFTFNCTQPLYLYFVLLETKHNKNNYCLALAIISSNLCVKFFLP